VCEIASPRKEFRDLGTADKWFRQKLYNSSFLPSKILNLQTFLNFKIPTFKMRIGVMMMFIKKYTVFGSFLLF
jgi:hypothetical protein